MKKILVYSLCLLGAAAIILAVVMSILYFGKKHGKFLTKKKAAHH